MGHARMVHQPPISSNFSQRFGGEKKWLETNIWMYLSLSFENLLAVAGSNDFSRKICISSLLLDR